MATVAQASSPHVVPGMIEGLWLGPDEPIPSKPDTFVNAIVPRPSTELARDESFQCLNLVQTTLADRYREWTWTVLSEAGIYTWGHTIGLTLKEPWRFVTWVLGSPRSYSVAYAPWLPPAEISAAYGPGAAACARTDFPSVQLQLTLVP